MDAEVPELLLPPRILLGPGPSMADPRVLRAMSTPLLGQFDPDFTTIMREVMALSRVVFQTQNPCTFPVSGTGRAGLEAAIASFTSLVIGSSSPSAAASACCAGTSPSGTAPRSPGSVANGAPPSIPTPCARR
jgi:hypothetical protein